MKEISFLLELSPHGNDRLRVEALKEEGKILSFLVQYESYIEGKWRPIVRYDTAHSFAHRDILHPDGSKSKQPLFFQSYNEAFTFAIQDLKLNWKIYESRYTEDMKK